MKLWHKISLLCSLILVTVVTICTATQLLKTRENLFEMTYFKAHNKLISLEVSFQKMVQHYSDESDSESAENALLHYWFSRFADSGAVLVVNGETIWSETDIDPEAYCTWEDGAGSVASMVNINGRRMMIEGRKTHLATPSQPICHVYVLEDFTVVDETVQDMAADFILVGTGGILIGLIFITLLVKRAVKPLEKLETAAAHIAQGNYTHRAEIASKDEIGKLACSFNSMADSVEEKITELMETAERQRLFIGAVTHEFKTPLTGILLNADNLQNTYMTEEEQMNALSAIETQGKWLERLVQQMLKLLTISREIVHQNFSASVLLDRVKESTQDILVKRKVRLEMHQTDFTIYGDIDLLQSALVNLIDNASKASHSGQTISVTAAPDYIEVKDHGCGIPEEAMPHITEAFYMADRSRSKQQGGVGLGLALVQEIVTAHGAALRIESAANVGTTIRILLKR